jgi:hypothetical protein
VRRYFSFQGRFKEQFNCQGLTARPWNASSMTASEMDRLTGVDMDRPHITHPTTLTSSQNCHESTANSTRFEPRFDPHSASQPLHSPAAAICAATRRRRHRPSTLPTHAISSSPLPAPRRPTFSRAPSIVPPALARSTAALRPTGERRPPACVHMDSTRERKRHNRGWSRQQRGGDPCRIALDLLYYSNANGLKPT